MKLIDYGTVVQFNDKSEEYYGCLGVVVSDPLHSLGQYGVVMTAVRVEDGTLMNCLVHTKKFGDELEVIGTTNLIPQI